MLRVYTGNRLDKLLTKMDSNIKNNLNTPLSKIPVCIQTPGMQRWIGLKLAEQTGISANLDFIFPGALMKRLAGVRAGEQTPWPEKQELTWRIFDRLLKIPQTPVFENINNYLADDTDNIKSFRLAMRIADTFDQYQIYRPQMVLDWLNPKPKMLPSDQKDLWQVELFQSLFSERIGCKTFAFDRFIKDCKKGRPNTQLKAPLHIFGISVLPIFFIEMLKAASNYTDVFFYLLSPTRQYWGDSKTIREKRRMEKITAKTAEDLYIDEKHELLDNLGVIGRDFFDYIFGSDESFIESDDYDDIPKKSILSTIQAEILDLEYGSEMPAYDGSIIINNSHNPLREIETLYDQLLEIFNNDSTMHPSDVLVMTPDIEKYSPYIKAVFDNPYSENARIPYSVADVSEKHSSRPAGVFLELIKTIRGDFSLMDVVKILSYDIIADKFDISQSDIKTLSSVLERTGAFWGYNSDHLKRNDLNIDDGFTWQKALRRMALGLAEGDTGATYNDVAGRNIPFSLAAEIGGLMKFVDLSAKYAAEFEANKPPNEWCALLHQMAEDFIGDSYEYADEMLYLNKCIADINHEVEAGGFTSDIPSEPLLERLTEALSETRGAKGFISGRATFCAMLPMRSIPFRVICIIGLDENTFPRQKVSLEFDLVAKHPIAGDRNNRDSDRYLFLETLISAQEKLILSYVGQSERDNAELPPSTLITELCTHLGNRFSISDIIQKQKLHSFSRDYFKNDNLYTYSPARYEASLAFSSDKKARGFSDTQLDTEDINSVTLDEFERFFISPPEHFLRRILGVNPNVRGETLPQTEVLTVDTLLKYSLEDESIKERLSGTDPQDTLDYLYKTAQLPPENLGLFHIESTKEKSREISERASEFLGGAPEAVAIDIEIDGLTITGKIEGVNGNRHIYVKPAELKPKDLLRAWIRHLIINSHHEAGTEIIGTNGSISLHPLKGGQLAGLVQTFRKGQKQPLRFHATDAIQLFKFKGIEKDKYNNIEKDYSFSICFGEGTSIDMETVEAVIKPLHDHLEQSK